MTQVQDNVTVTREYILGPENTPFYTIRWAPKNEEPKAHVVFVHGFAEHVERYTHFFPILASPPYSLSILAFDQRGHGRTSQEPLTSSSSEVIQWKKEGRPVKLEKNAKRRTGGWAKILPDIEWFVRYEHDRAKSKGKKLFLWGFSMGGAEVLRFTLKSSSQIRTLVAGVIAGGSLIRLKDAAPWIKLKAGTLAANLGLGNMLIPAPMDSTLFSHNPESNERAQLDPFCEQIGSTRGMADMINGGALLDRSEAWEAWPKEMPLLVYHGGEDGICDVEAARRFERGVKAADKTLYVVEGMYHEVHNEYEPVPTQVATTVAQWIIDRSGVNLDITTTTITSDADTTSKSAEPDLPTLAVKETEAEKYERKEGDEGKDYAVHGSNEAGEEGVQTSTGVAKL